MKETCKYCKRLTTEKGTCSPCGRIRKQVVQELAGWMWEQFENHAGSYSADRANEELMQNIGYILENF
jgi:hypothetical protein